MQLPILCPACNQPLLNNYKDYPTNRPYRLEKSCRIKPDHIFFCASKKGCDDEIGFLKITIDTNKMLTFNWELNIKRLYFTTGYMPNIITDIPYFEPDLSNYIKLVKKIKIIVPFA